jgi:hypothetical protein
VNLGKTSGAGGRSIGMSGVGSGIGNGKALSARHRSHIADIAALVIETDACDVVDGGLQTHPGVPFVQGLLVEVKHRSFNIDCICA